MTTTFSSVHLRERDKIIEEKYKKEISAVEGKLERVKRSLLAADKEIFDLRNRGNDLARVLGFSDIGEVQRAIDVADHQATFHEAFERVQILEDEIRAVRDEKEGLQDRCQELEAELDVLRQRGTTWEKDERRLRRELSDLQVQYDQLKSNKERSASYFKRCYKNMNNFNKWLFGEDSKNKKGTEEEIWRHADSKKTELLRELGPGIMRQFGIDVSTFEKELDDALVSNAEAVPMQGTPKTQIPNALSATSNANTDVKIEQASPRKPLSDLLIPNHAPETTPKATKLVASADLKSSDTEDDSQAPPQLFKRPFALPSHTRASNPASYPSYSSDTEDDSQAPSAINSSPCLPPLTPLTFVKTKNRPFIDSNTSPRPFVKHARRQSDIGTSSNRVKLEPEEDADSRERPAKRPRINLEADLSTPTNPNQKLTSQRLVASTGNMKGKRFQDENTPTIKQITTIRTLGQTRLEDYTSYKGRGRYARENQPAAKTINSLYTINPERNGGAGHQFEEVIRNKQDRARMEGSDCEECREYYAAVGPLPPRDRGPLWRSPSTTPVKKCKRHDEHFSTTSTSDDNFGSSPTPINRKQAEIDAHKKTVSRHRHNWARPKTPPGYWNIGFPDTQEANEINQRAEEMHRKKFKDVQKEAERGRWVRR